jgi:peptidyl-prolyl cis-trans isomerase C
MKKALILVVLVAACHKKEADKPAQEVRDHSSPTKPGGAPASSAAATPSNLPPQPQADLDSVVAVIDGEKITVADFQKRINEQNPYVRARYTSLEQKKDFLDNWIRFEVMAREALKRGYDKDDEVVRTMKQVMIQKLMKEQFESLVKPEDITDNEMQQFYKLHTDEYNKPEEVRVSAVIVKSEDVANTVAKEARAQPAQDNTAFRGLVEKYSEDAESKALFGDLRFFAADSAQIPPEVSKAAFKLQNTGDVAGPIKTSRGFFVIKQTGRRAAIAKTFEDVKRQIQNRIYRDRRTEAMNRFVENLKKEAKVDVHADALGKVRVDTSMPAAMPGPQPEPGEPQPAQPVQPVQPK